MLLFFFFFSSRRRHTRFDCDWSSDVCSSDLLIMAICRSVLRSEAAKNPSPADVLHKVNRQLYPDIKEDMFRSEEHTSELQSQSNLVCRLLLEKKKKIKTQHSIYISIIL